MNRPIRCLRALLLPTAFAPPSHDISDKVRHPTDYFVNQRPGRRRLLAQCHSFRDQPGSFFQPRIRVVVQRCQPLAALDLVAKPAVELESRRLDQSRLPFFRARRPARRTQCPGARSQFRRRIPLPGAVTSSFPRAAAIAAVRPPRGRHHPAGE